MYENLDIYAKADADPDVLANLGPLAPLAGIWEGDAGIDISPSAGGAVENLYRERMLGCDERSLIPVPEPPQ